MPILINSDGVIERITFDKPAKVERAEYEASFLQKILNCFWRVVTGGGL